MQVVYGFRVNPGCCHVCRTADGSLPVIDTSREDPGEIKRFHVYICSQCVKAMAKLVAPAIGAQLIDDAVLAEWDEQVDGALEWRRRAERAEEVLQRVNELAMHGGGG